MKATGFTVVKSLLGKQWIERTYSYKKGNFDLIGFLLRLLIAAAFVAVFVIFFGKFVGIYTNIKTYGQPDVTTRLKELLTICYTALIAFMTIGAMGKISKDIFGADDVKIFAAMPVSSWSLYAAKLIYIYVEQFIISLICVLTLNLTLAAHVQLSDIYYVLTAVMCIVLPLVTIAIASLVSLPYHALKRFLSDKFVITFVLITIITGVLFYVYSVLVSAVNEMLIGESLQYFFNERIMNGIARICGALYPARFIANLLLGESLAISITGIAGIIAVCAVVSAIVLKLVLKRALQDRIAGTGSFIKRKRRTSRKTNQLFALIKKEFLLIFRTPSYMFSYFSVAVIMPLMVYTCMSIGSSLVLKLVDLNCNIEIAFFLTLLFGSLTNVFCATNVSRDGHMFYICKAMPLSCKKVFMSKITLCMAVAMLSQYASAVLLVIFGYVPWYAGIMLFITGTVFGFVSICVATRYDFNNARFSTEDDGEITESSGVVSVIILLGLIISFVLGGAVFAARILLLLRGNNAGYLTYLIALVSAAACGVGAYFYLTKGLGKKYYEFDGGNV